MSSTSFYAEQMSVDQFATSAALRYSTYVIGSRTVPHVGDGLKTVHRRILFSMYELGLRPDAMFKKSARTVGDALGKYHPHGDSACYEAMVLMAQPFSMRVPMISAQGNWGSIADPKSFAAMRYTESKMTPYSFLMMSEIKQDTVDWVANYDDSMKEPAVLPARLPNILINGASGIAWGFALYIPSHNPAEIIAACKQVLSEPSVSDDDILGHIAGPDFSRGGHIANSADEIREIYKTGRGKLRNRGTYHVDGDSLIITSIPEDASLDRIVQQISSEVEASKLPVIGINEEIDGVTLKLTLTLRNKAVDADALMSHFFATTDLEKTVNVMPYAISEDLSLKRYTIPELVRDWCIFRENTVRKRLQHRLTQIEKRLHLLFGYRCVFDALDLAITLIRHDDDPKSALMTQLQLSETQAQAVLELQLRHLAKLELNNIIKEIDSLEKEQSQIKSLLSSEKRLKSRVLKELEEDAKPYLQPRLTTVGARAPAKRFEAPDLLNQQGPVTVIVSKSWWVRAQKGHQVDAQTLAFKTGDSLRTQIKTTSDNSLLLMDSSGRFYSVFASDCPSGRGVGEPIHAGNRLSIDDPSALLAIFPHQPQGRVLLTTAGGLGFLTSSEGLITRNKKGKEVLRLTAGDAANPPVMLKDEPYVAILSRLGKVLIVRTAEINESSKSQGVCLIKIRNDDFASGKDALVQALPLHANSVLTIHFQKNKPTQLTPAKWQTLIGARARVGTSFQSPIAISVSTNGQEVN